MNREYTPIFITEDGTILMPSREIQSIFAAKNKGTYSIIASYGGFGSNALINGLDRKQSEQVLAGIAIALKNKEPIISFSVSLDEALISISEKKTEEQEEGEKNEDLL